MTIDSWKNSFAAFARQSLKTNSEAFKNDKYYRALAACDDVLSGTRNAASFIVQSWKPDYGSAIITSEVIHDPLTLKVWIVGLDEWAFTIDEKGSNNATCEGDPAFVHVYDVPREKIKIFLREVDKKLAKAGTKEGSSRHSSNQDGGVQHTPGFLLSTCMKVICATEENEIFKNPPEIIPQCSGFTDVGMHTGCNLRDTSLSLVQAVLKVTLKFGMVTELSDAYHFFARFMAEYFLDLAQKCSNGVSLLSCTKEQINEVMRYLTFVSRYISPPCSDHFGTELVANISKRCQTIRKHLEEVKYKQALQDSKQFEVLLPDLSVITDAPSPRFSLKSISFHQERKLTWEEMYDAAKENLHWIPVQEINTLDDCKKLLEDTRFESSEAYTFSIVFVSIEMFLLKMANDYLSEYSKSSKGIDPDLLVLVCKKYEEKLNVIETEKIGGLLSNELLSHKVLIGWLRFCLLFKMACDEISLLSSFSVPLRYCDLEHLVLKDKWAWEMLDLISNFLKRNSKEGKEVAFFGDEDAMLSFGMLSLADKYVAEDSEFDAYWADEQNEASKRIHKRWDDIQRQKKTCSELREAIKKLRHKIDETTSERNRKPKYVEESYYYGKGEYRTRNVINPDWKRLDEDLNNLNSNLKSKEGKLTEAQKAPVYLKQPLPADKHYGKRALFFIHMPKLLSYAWQASFEAQEMIFSDGNSMNISGCEFHSFYEGPYTYRLKKNVNRTPIQLYIPHPPKNYGTTNVENIFDKNDGVWHPYDFSPSFSWKSGRNPFTGSRSNAVKQFVEPVTDLKWTVIQQGSETPADRGNLALSKLHEKPLTMTRGQFLSLGNLRAQPLLQLFHLLDSIKNRSLPFQTKYIQITQTVVRQVLFHIGEIKEFPSQELLVKLWKFGVEPLDQEFMNKFQVVLVEAIEWLKDASKHENELLIYFEIVSFLSQFDYRFNEVMDICFDTALGWAMRMESEIQRARDKTNFELILKTQRKQHLYLLYALLSYEMILPQYLLENKRINKIIELTIQICSCRPKQLDEDATNLMNRAYFFMARILPALNDKSQHSFDIDSLLTESVKKIFPNHADNKMVWKCFEYSYCWWNKNASGDYLSLNIMNGLFLINGSPPSSLPVSIRKHSMFQRVFGDIDFEVTLNNNGLHKALKPIKGRYYSFQLIGDDLLIFEEYDDEKLMLLDNRAGSAWVKDIPTGMLHLYSHWQSQKSRVVLFRPISFRERSIYYLWKDNGLFKVPRHHHELSSRVSLETLVENSVYYDRLILLDSRSKAGIHFFFKFDDPDYIHTYLTYENVFKVLLTRYRISFELKQGAQAYECPELGGYKLCSSQQLSDMLYGFYKYLILVKGNTDLTVIIPEGSVKMSNGEVLIESIHPEVIDEISQTSRSCSKFTVHPRFRHLLAMDLLSGLQLAAIQACTSSSLPEQGTCMTGHEMAIEQIRKCWINRPLDSAELLMVKSLLSLNNLPSALVILVHELVKSSFQLSFLYLSASLENNLNMNEYVKAVNDYHLPLQNHLSFRNYRLSLTTEELRLYLGTHKPTSYFNGIKSQLETFLSYRTLVKEGNSYIRKKEDISRYESQLNNLTNSKINEQSPFPLQNLPTFKNKEIGNRMVNGLKLSYEQHAVIPKANLYYGIEKTLQELNILREKVRKEYNELLELLSSRIIDCTHKIASSATDAILIHRASNAIPTLTFYDLIKASWLPHILRYFNPLLTENDVHEVKDIIIDWMQFSVLDDKITRIIKHLTSNAIDFAVQELQAHRKYNTYDQPQWLAFEYDQGLQIRPEQEIIIDGILNSNDSVVQLNMGLGKTRVIVPCLILEFSRRKKIPRVYFLSSLMDEGFEYLRNTLTGGVFTKKLFRYPFNRDVELTVDQAASFIASLKHCEFVEGSVVLSPEHSLSILLKGFELERYTEKVEITQNIREAENLPFADIYDEVDEMMLPNQELIYAEGSPIALKSGPRRWGAVFSLLFTLRNDLDYLYMDSLKREGCATFKSVNCHMDEFNSFQLLPGKQLQKQLRTFLDEITNSLFSTKVRSPSFSTLNWMREIKSEKFKDRIKEFIINPCTPANTINESELLHQDHFQDLLVLRGLLGYEILIHCLKLRHNIDYGVVANHKTLMAIPFRAANLPKLRSEFAQPDCSVVCTVLSYYNVGLTRTQVMETFASLLSCGPSFQQQVYKEIFELCEKSNEEKTNILQSINLVHKLDLANEEQFDLLYRSYRKNMLLINFWLSHVLFPTATMVFPGKLMASSWNLTDTRKSHVRCGFSGTDDACIFLPGTLVYRSPDVPSLKATNGKMLEHLCNSKKATFCSISPHPGKDIESVLADLAYNNEVDALIDAGALLNNHPIEKVADIFLEKLRHADKKFKGVVYYSTIKVCWCIKDMNRRETSLSSSPISECDAFVIFDQSRCRGADMKLRPDAKAFLSIGPGQRKDSFIQAAGRLRQLDFGQSIIAIAMPEIEILMKDCLGIPSTQEITMDHVLSYVLYNSVDAIGNSLKHWSSQGVRFLRFVLDPSNVRGEEKCDLETLYAGSDKTCTVSEIILPKLKSIEESYCSSSDTSAAIMKVIRERTTELGADVVANLVENFDECERELEQEREMENEKEEEMPLMHPFKEEDWNYDVLFSVDSPSKISLVRPMAVADFVKDFLSDPASAIKWEVSKVFMTPNFARPLLENPPYDNFLRPVRLLLYFPQNKEFLAVSEREADKIWRRYLERSFNQKSGGPILCSINFLLSDRNETALLGSVVSSPGDIQAVTHAALTLFNGQTAFGQKDQDALRTALLLSREAVGAATFFCDHRGFRVMFHGSDLEETCNQICQILHDQNCDSSPEGE